MKNLSVIACIAATVALRAPAFTLIDFIPEDADLDTEVKATGCAPEEAFIYESLPDAADAARLGFGAFAVTPAHKWRKIYRPEPLPRRNLVQLRRPAQSGLPVICDLAIPPWSHGALRVMPGVRPEDECWPEPASDSIRFSVANQASRDFWASIWKADFIDFTNTFQTVPSSCRLFAAANLDDTASQALSAFRAFLRARYNGRPQDYKKETGDTASASFSAISRRETLASRVLFSMFLEQSFADAVALGAKTAAPVPVFFQTLSDRLPNIDPALACEACKGPVCAPAVTATPRYTSLYWHAIAKDRPIIAPDIHPTADAAKTRMQIIASGALGYDFAALTSARRNPRKWTKYGKDPATGKTRVDPQATEAAGKEYAAKFPGNWMNPFAVPASAVVEALHGAAEEAEAAAPKPAEAPVLLLHSRTSERLELLEPERAEKTASLAAWVDAFDKAEVPVEIILERDFATNNVQKNARAVVVPPCIRACLDETPSAVSNFVANGGTLLLSNEALRENRFGGQVRETPFPDGAHVCETPEDAVKFLNDEVH